MSARSRIPNCPRGWNTYKIGDILAVLPNGKDLHQGWSPQCRSEAALPGEWGVLKTTAIQAGAFEPEHNKALPDHLEPRTDIVVEVGDLLLTCAGPRSRCGVPCLVRRTQPRLMMSGKMYRFRPRSDLAVPAFIEAQLLAQPWQDAIDDMKTGISDSGLNLTHGRFRELPVHLPPIPEQQQIVAAIETHFSRLDAAVASLTRAKANVKRARASVLKAAVEGRLVPTEAALARAEGRDYEPASVLLEQILAERKAAWAASGARGKYKEPVKPETEGLPELPVGWVWATLEQLGEGARPFAYGVLVPGPDVPDGVPFVRVGDIGEGSVADRPEKSIARTVADKFKRTYLQGGELLLSIVGTIGRVGVASAHLKGANVARAVGVLPLVERISSQFVVFAIRSHATQHRLVGAAHEVARKTLNMEDVRATVVPVPPLAEQYRIVAEVDRRFSVLDALNATLDANLARCARLRQSVLKRAFEGRLVPADTAEG